MSSSAFCIDAAASTVMCLPCVDGDDVATIAYSPAIAASMSVISTPGSSRSNCIRAPAGSAHNYIQFARVSQGQLSADVRLGSIASNTMFAMSGLASIASVMLQCHDRSKSAITGRTRNTISFRIGRPCSRPMGSSSGANILTNEVYSLLAADFWKPATTQAINIGLPTDTVRISQTIPEPSSQPEPSASASKDL